MVQVKGRGEVPLNFRLPNPYPTAISPHMYGLQILQLASALATAGATERCRRVQPATIARYDARLGVDVRTCRPPSYVTWGKEPRTSRLPNVAVYVHERVFEKLETSWACRICTILDLPRDLEHDGVA